MATVGPDRLRAMAAQIDVLNRMGATIGDRLTPALHAEVVALMRRSRVLLARADTVPEPDLDSLLLAWEDVSERVLRDLAR